MVWRMAYEFQSTFKPNFVELYKERIEYSLKMANGYHQKANMNLSLPN